MSAFIRGIRMPLSTTSMPVSFRTVSNPPDRLGDLDPPGIDIIVNLSIKSGRSIEPAAMSADLYKASYTLEEEPDALEGWCARCDPGDGRTRSVPSPDPSHRP
ncbi:hypothetical protein [Streptomyces sp. ID05-47C]|uniref:hypothetical protein n=1 Tax=Streptomyces sp. ID05-47C TaxID=3028665 RepID=UPI0029A28FC6|nr:hypothetical protein [Streptomyces sp. ID05-47C]MDX3568679.1 hypothetical protein [Streptomyces sp. ID05-47C]